MWLLRESHGQALQDAPVSFTFLLGTHMPSWLGKTDLPLFVSQRTLSRQKTYPRACGPWALDSGGFSELSLFGEWRTGEREYIRAVRRYERDIGQLVWVAPQDWMCEPFILQKTGLSILEHQQRTIASYLSLLEEGLPVIPVLQGYEVDDYARCIDLYEREGVDLWRLPVVGLGSVCRRQGTEEIARLVRDLARQGLRLHGFGVKVTGLRAIASYLRSADSLSWSYGARREPPLPGCSGHKNCANCLTYAMRWRGRLLDTLNTSIYRS